MGWSDRSFARRTAGKNGADISHGHLIPYVVPTESFIRYMKEKQIKRVIDAGITDIYLEEPEFG